MTDNLLEEGDDLPNIDLTKDYLEELTKPGGKFDKTKYNSELEAYKAIARGKYEGDQFIEIMKKRQDELRADYLKIREENVTRAKLEEMLTEFSQKQLTSNNEPTVKEESPRIDPKEIESLVSSKIQEHEASKKQQENFDTVRNKLKERYGNNYQNVLKEQISDLGLTEEFVNELARKHPQVLYKTLGLDRQQQTEPFQAPLRSNQRNDNFAPTGAKKRTWAYYQELKKANPKIYFDPKTAVQMQNDILELGEAFKDGDYKVYGD